MNEEEDRAKRVPTSTVTRLRDLFVCELGPKGLEGRNFKVRSMLILGDKIFLWKIISTSTLSILFTKVLC
jgi:hypothetical protein